MALTLTAARVAYQPVFEGKFGHLIFTLTNSASSTYATNGFTLDLSAIKNLPSPSDTVAKLILCIEAIGTHAGYQFQFVKAAAPTLANLGTIKLYTSGGTETANATSFNDVVWTFIAHLFHTRTS